MRPWWDWEGAVRRQLAQLRSAGFDATLDESAWREGSAVIRITHVIDGEALNLAVHFSPLYPYVRFEIAADIDLPRHRNPLNGYLCVIGRTPENWRTTDSVVDFIRDRVPAVLRAARSNDPQERAQLEEPQGEPITDLIPYANRSIISLDGSWSLPATVTSGEIRLLVATDDLEVRGVVTEVRSGEERFAALAEGLTAGFDTPLLGFWIRLPSTPRAFDVGSLFSEVYRLLPRFRTDRGQLIDGRLYSVCGVTFPQEVAANTSGVGWIFLVRSFPVGNPRGASLYCVRAGFVGSADLAQRVPFFSQMQARRVALIGVGALGGQLAIELAKAGVGELRLLDGDYVDPGNSVRWPLGLDAAGLPKVTALSSFITFSFPHTRCVEISHRLGVPNTTSAEWDAIEKVCSEVDIIIDATADINLQQFFSDLAEVHSLPYVCLSATPGLWGGTVVRVPANAHGCWTCFRTMLMMGDIGPPHADPAGLMQPVGCGDRTFVGAAFDAAEITQAAARIVVTELCRSDAQPSLPWDIAILQLRTADGAPIPPTWATYPLTRHANCQKCRLRQ